jgi:hypothetical protein
MCELKGSLRLWLTTADPGSGSSSAGLIFPAFCASLSRQRFYCIYRQWYPAAQLQAQILLIRGGRSRDIIGDSQQKQVRGTECPDLP